MRDLAADLRYGLRMVVKRPGTSVLAVLALSLGIGLTTIMFGIVQGVILRGLPFDEPEQIVAIGRRNVTDTGNGGSLPLHDFIDYRASQRSFEDIGGFSGFGASVSGAMAAERYRGARITFNTLRLLRVAPALGRDFVEADSAPGAEKVAIISHGMWTSQFKQDPAVTSRVIRVNGYPVSIVGVAPATFAFPQRQDIWMPVEMAPAAKRGTGTFLQTFARLKRDVSLDEAAAELAGIAKRLEDRYPENKGLTSRVVPYLQRVLGNDVRTTLLAMLGAVFGVMLIACANVTSLQLARAAERVKEIAVRTALGAGRGRIVRQILLEGLVLSATGALVGLAISATGLMLFNRAIVDTNPPFWIDIRIDRTVLLFVTAIAVVAAIASSLVPALRATKLNLNAVLKDEGRANTGIRMGHFSRWLVVGEVFLSCCLLVVSGLLIKSVVTISRIAYPYATTDIFVANVWIEDLKHPKDPDIIRIASALDERWNAVTGVRRAAISSGTPAQAGSSVVLPEGRTYPTDNARPSARRLAVSPSFFEVLRVNLLRGRLFTDADTTGAPLVVVVDDAFAAKHYPGEDAIGRRVTIGGDASAKLWTIVGIVPRLGVAQQNGETPDMIYVPFEQAPVRGVTVLAQTSGTPTAITNGMRSATALVDEDMALAGSKSLDAMLAEQRWAIWVFGSLFMSFGVAALVLAGAGLYGVMSFTVRRRTQEIGVRMALGAGRGSIAGMVLWQGLWRVALGVALGLVPAYFLADAMKALFFAVTPNDAWVFGGAVVFLLVTGLISSLVPALRAASVDPLVALRDS